MAIDVRLKRATTEDRPYKRINVNSKRLPLLFDWIRPLGYHARQFILA